MLFKIKSYFIFLWYSKNEHAVHSPFVFNLITKCFYDKNKKTEYNTLNQFRKSVLENKNSIEITDFGAGSKVFKSNIRSINQIAKKCGITSKRAELLFRITNYFKPNLVLELGTSLGLGTFALAIGNPNARIITLEGCPSTYTFAKQILNLYKLHNVNCVLTEFSFYLSNFQFPIKNKDFLSPQLIYFDGNHSKQATLNYFEQLVPTITNESIWIFDDIHWSPEMEKAWEIIKKHPKVTVTIDTYYWGFVFFRKEQSKEHFIIRI